MQEFPVPDRRTAAAPRLLQPITIRTLTLRNRIVFPPVTTGYEHEGHVTPRSRHFYRTIARGGAGLIVIGDVSIQPSFTPTPCVYDDSFVPGLRALADDVHAEGACIAAQLFHQEYDAAALGRIARSDGRAAAMQRLHHDMEHYCGELTHDDIAAILERFRDAARRVHAAGFDMIQVHGDRLLGMFTSGILNRRTDDYGGPLRNRARFALEVVRTIRDAAPELPIEYKLPIIRTDPPLGKGGPTLAEAEIMVPWLEEAGVASLHVALANHGAIGDTIPPMGTQPFGCFVDLAEVVKRVARVPVTAVGRIVDPDFAEELLAAGKANLVGICRGLIAEPDWPRGLQPEAREDLRPCIMCNHCASSLMSGTAMRCAINATIGEEAEEVPVQVSTPRRVLVLGGGPAGMEAAHTAARRGHRVTLVEQRDELGGQLALCATPVHKHEMAKLARYLITQVHKQGVQVRLGVTEHLSAVLDRHPADAVVVATGSSPAMPVVPGIERPEVMSAWQAMAEAAPNRREVVVVGGGSVGVETALHLAAHGSRITVVEMTDTIATGESPTVLPFIHREIARYGMRVLTGHRLLGIDDAGVHLAANDGGARCVKADQVVMAVGIRRNASFRDELTALGLECHVVGDCADDSPGTIAAAIRAGFRAGMSV